MRLQSQKIQRILRKAGIAEDALERMIRRIPLSDLNTLLLEVFRGVVDRSTSGELLRRYASNRFVHPSRLNPLQLKQLELNALGIAGSHLYIPIQLSPVTPLGTSSIVAPANQDKVISALRGTEVVSDATNALALHICHSIRSGSLEYEQKMIRYSATHHHVRAQHFSKSTQFPHFNLFCLVTAGKDKGSYSFETLSFREQISIYAEFFESILHTKIRVVLSARAGDQHDSPLLERVLEEGRSKLPAIDVSAAGLSTDHTYYKGLQFTIYVHLKGQEVPIGDGGFVDWSQQLLQNRKERMLVSAIGLDRLLLQ